MPLCHLTNYHSEKEEQTIEVGSLECMHTPTSDILATIPELSRTLGAVSLPWTMGDGRQ